MAKRKDPQGSGVRYERVELEALRPDERNARKHSDRNLKAVEDSLRKFGQQKPIVATDDGKVIAGNATLEAARRLGWTHIEVVRTHLSGPDAVAYAIADNRTAELAEWDADELKRQLDELAVDGISPDDLSFEPADLEEIAASVKAEEDVERNDELYAAVADPMTEEEMPEAHSVWRIGEGSILLVMHPVNDVDEWRHYLEGIELFVPYPSCHATIADRFKDKRCLFVQPIRQSAGYFLRCARIAGVSIEEVP